MAAIPTSSGACAIVFASERKLSLPSTPVCFVGAAGSIYSASDNVAGTNPAVTRALYIYIYIYIHRHPLGVSPPSQLQPKASASDFPNHFAPVEI